jgi:hypothetical protein
LGPVVFVFGTTLGVFAATEELSRRGSAPGVRLHVQDSFADPRAGLYLGAVLPKTSRFRLRTQLDGEITLAAHASDMTALPTYAKWSLGLSLGAETAFLP